MDDPTDSLPQILTTLKQLLAENATLCKSLLDLQFATSSVTPTIKLNPLPPYYEPKVNLLDKFDGTRSRLRSFLNQICLIIRLVTPQVPTRSVSWVHY